MPREHLTVKSIQNDSNAKRNIITRIESSEAREHSDSLTAGRCVVAFDLLLRATIFFEMILHIFNEFSATGFPTFSCIERPFEWAFSERAIEADSLRTVNRGVLH